MSTLVHSHMCTSVPEIPGNMCTSVPKGPPLSFLVLLLRFSIYLVKGYADLHVPCARETETIFEASFTGDSAPSTPIRGTLTRAAQ